MIALYLSRVARALRFWSRLPLAPLRVEIDPHGPPVMAELAAAVPVAGAIIGLVGAAVLVVALTLGLTAWPGAVLSTAALVIATGAMQEDALADVADGFGGGRTIERKLAIMKDPRLGTYGASALALALLLRIALLAALVAGAGPMRAALVVVGAASVSRIAGMWPLVALGPARADGLGAAAVLPAGPWRTGAWVGALLCAGLCALGATSALALLSPLAAFAAAWGMTRLARTQIGGQTGDVCGAATGLAELGVLAFALACLSV